MKIILFILLGINALFATSRIEHVTIQNQDFTVSTEDYNLYENKGTTMKLFKGSEFVLSSTLHDVTGVCASKSIQEGSYEINGTDIVLYSQWDRQGSANYAPLGARIQHYRILPDFSVKLVSSKLYIESDARGYNDDSGMQYLFTTPTSPAQKEALKEYIQEMERTYQGTFVFADEAKELIDEVKKALIRKMKRNWRR